jgi:putative inorganic carbon (hco3(-)) transporter
MFTNKAKTNRFTTMRPPSAGRVDAESEPSDEFIEGVGREVRPPTAIAGIHPARPSKGAVRGTRRDSGRAETGSDAKDIELLSKDRWLKRYGHTFTYAGIFLFTVTLYFRPYELIPALSGFNSLAYAVALVTLLVYLPTQLTVEGTPTAFTVEVKCVLLMMLWGILTIPIARDPGLAWATFSDSFIRVIVIFVIMLNTLRTERRIKGILWLGIAVGMMLGYEAIDLYRRGEFKTEGYRVSVEFGGMFGNPNDLSIHLVMFIPIAIVLGMASRNKLYKAFCFVSAGLMTAGCFVTQSRGGFLGLIAMAAVLVWKFGKLHRVKTIAISAAVGLIVILLAPGNYGLRILSIFIPALDPAGSSDQRTELLMRSIWVSLRNPLGIGMGNFEIVGVHNLGTHNAYTQVASELGIFAFGAYLILLISPLRKLAAVERQTFGKADPGWMYYLSVGLQACIVGYMVSSFFSSVAYQWYVYYPIACAVGLRRIYQLDAMNVAEPATPRRAVPAFAAT